MKINKNMSLANFEANVRFQLYKRGMTIDYLANMYEVTSKNLLNILCGKDKSPGAKEIISDIIKYF